MINIKEDKITENWRYVAEQPVVSICCLTYNHEQYLSQALDSFLMQITDFPFEIIIGEDCSTDNTRKIIEQYMKKYPKIIKLVTSSSNVGLQENSYRTMHACNGEYIALCDGDDYWLDNKKLQIQINEMKQNVNIGISFHPASKLIQDGKIIKSNFSYKKFYSLSEIVESDFHFISTNTIIFKKDILNKIDKDIFLKSPVNDVWIRIISSMESGAICINREMSIYRVQSSGSWTESMKNSEKFISFIENMIFSINEFDNYFNNRYEILFLKLKQKFFRIILFKQDLSFEIKKDFIKKHIYLSSFKDKFFWFIIFSHPKMLKIIRKIKYKVLN